MIAAGNERELLGYGSIDSPGAAQSAITVAATSSSRFFARSSTISGSAPVPASLRSFGVAVPGLRPCAAAGCRRAIVAASSVGRFAALHRGATTGSLAGVIALAGSRRLLGAEEGAHRPGGGRHSVLVPPYDASPPVPELDQTAVPVLVAPAPVVSIARAATWRRGVRPG